MSAAPRLPLSGLTVVAVEHAVAAPFCTCRLADAGARVIKIERPGGDMARGYDDAANGISSYFAWLNRGKESLVLDLRDAGGRAALATLVASADILVQNLRPSARERLGLAPETLRQRHPELICCSITGYGEDGPLASSKAYDLLIQAESGLASITGGPDGPARVGISIVDIATGATAHAAILEAVVTRLRSGQGSDIRVSMFDVIAEWMTVPLLHQEAGRPPQRLGLAHPSIAPYGIFRTADGSPIILAVQSDGEWATLCTRLLDLEALARDPRFATNLARVRNRAETDRIVGEAIGRWSTEEVLLLLKRSDIAFARVNNLEDLSNHPHLRRISVESPAGRIEHPAPAPIVVGEQRHFGPVPELGENRLGPKPSSAVAMD